MQHMFHLNLCGLACLLFRYISFLLRDVKNVGLWRTWKLQFHFWTRDISNQKSLKIHWTPDPKPWTPDPRPQEPGSRAQTTWSLQKWFNWALKSKSYWRIAIFERHCWTLFEISAGARARVQFSVTNVGYFRVEINKTSSDKFSIFFVTFRCF